MKKYLCFGIKAIKACPFDISSALPLIKPLNYTAGGSVVVKVVIVGMGGALVFLSGFVCFGIGNRC